MELPESRDSRIAQMLYEIESDIIAREADVTDPMHHAYIVAKLELNSHNPDTAFVHNVLAMSLNKPLETRH